MKEPLCVLLKITCLLASVENSHDSLCLSSGELWEHYCCISHTIITLLLLITSILAFSQEIIIGYHTFLLDITYSHYCAFLNCFTFFWSGGHILLNCWELVNNGEFNRSNSFWSYESWKQNPGILLVRFPSAAIELSWSLSLSFLPLSWVRRGHPLAFSWKKLDKIQIGFFIFQ